MISDILSGIAQILKERYPDHTIYQNPKDSDMQLPCFFITALSGTQKQRLFGVIEEKDTIQITRFPQSQCETPAEENREIALALLQELHHIPAAGGVITPYSWSWNADQKNAAVQFQVRLRMKKREEDPFITTETTKGDVT